MRAKPYHGIQICECCAGTGGSSAWLGEVSDESLREDPEFADAYFDGVYDRPCEACDGQGRVYVLQPGAPFGVRRAHVLKHRAKQSARWWDCPISRAERAMGA